jgi:hypothetical protein
MAPWLVLFPMVAYPFPSATTEVWVDGSTERLRRLYPISTPKDDTSPAGSVDHHVHDPANRCACVPIWVSYATVRITPALLLSREYLMNSHHAQLDK